MTTDQAADDDRTIIRPREKSSVGNTLPIGTRLGEFELTGVVGEGGFGIVYTAWDHTLERTVAVKEYMPSSLAARGDASRVLVRSERHQETFDLGARSFVNEARLLAQFDHPALLKVYRFWEANGTAYMAMPFYEGRTLKQLLKERAEPPDEQWLLGLLGPISEALDVLHRENCFHRDIAPDNILMLDEHRPLLLDFGAARRVIGDREQELTVILKGGYAPIEQYAEIPELRQGPWTDVYALAATIHFALTGETPRSSMGRMVNDNYQPLASRLEGKYSEQFLSALDKALVVKPDQRLQNMTELREALGLNGGTSVPVSPRGAAATSAIDTSNASRATNNAGSTAVTEVKKSSVTLLMIAMVGVLAVAGLGWFMFGRTEPTPTVAIAPPVAAPPVQQIAEPPVAKHVNFEIHDEIAKVLDGQHGDYKVSAKPDASKLRIGKDFLGFSVESSKDGYVQVLLLGPDGKLNLIFPNAQSSNNLIKANQPMRLPQKSWPLEAAEPVGGETFLVIVSAQPRDYSEMATGTEYIFLNLPTGEAGRELASRWSRSTPILLGGLKSCPDADCESYGAAVFDVDVVN